MTTTTNYNFNDELPSPVRVVRESFHTTDIFAVTYPRTIDAVFKTLIPKEKTMTFSLLQSLYAENSERFRVISGIHQNSFDDKLHLSLAVNCGKSGSYTVHIYGYWKNYFRVCSVTMKDDDEEIKTIAVF